MSEYKVSEKAVFLWRIELTLFAFLPATISAITLLFHPILFYICTVLWIMWFFVSFAFYLPIKYKKLSYSLQDTTFILYSGVFYTKSTYLPIENIQHVSVSSTPIMQFFSLSKLTIYSMGRALTLPALDHKIALELRQTLLTKAGLW